MLAQSMLKPLAFVKALLALLISMSLLAHAQAPLITDTWPDPFEMSFERLSVNPTVPERVELDNGMIVYLLEDHTLPLVLGTAYVRAPSVYDPEDKIGLADLTASQLRGGGTKHLSPDQLDILLEGIASSVESGANASFASISFDTLTDHLEDTLSIFADVIMHPNFDEDRLEIARGQALEGIRRQNDNPVQVAVREFYSRVSDGHPSQNYSTVDTINAISRDDLIAFHETYFVPNETYLAITGDFDKDTILKLVNHAFESWEPQEVTPPEIPDMNPTPEPQVFLAIKDVSQSTVIMGHPSLYAYQDGYADFVIANGILGDGFKSRIFTEVRTNRGYAYSTGSFLTQGYKEPGLFVVYAITRVDVTLATIDTLLQEVKRLQSGGITQDELILEQETILNSAVFRATSANQVTARTARAELLGLEEGYYEAYIDRIQALDTAAVHASAENSMNPEAFVIMVVGNPALFDGDLSTFGEVHEIALD